MYVPEWVLIGILIRYFENFHDNGAPATTMIDHTPVNSMNGMARDRHSGTDDMVIESATWPFGYIESDFLKYL